MYIYIFFIVSWTNSVVFLCFHEPCMRSTPASPSLVRVRIWGFEFLGELFSFMVSESKAWNMCYISLNQLCVNHLKKISIHIHLFFLFVCTFQSLFLYCMLLSIQSVDNMIMTQFKLQICISLKCSTRMKSLEFLWM